MITKLNKIVNGPVTRHYICICPLCGEMFECTDEDIETETKYGTYERDVRCPTCGSFLWEKSGNIILSHITDGCGEEIVRFIQKKASDETLLPESDKNCV